MASHTDYPVHGTWEFAYIGPIDENNPTSVQLGSLAGLEGWKLEAKNSMDGDVAKICIFMTGPEETQLKFRLCYCLDFVNQDDSMSKTVTDRTMIERGTIVQGPWIVESEALDVKKGWLRNGQIIVEYGLYVEAIWMEHIWKFNFHDPTFNWEKTEDVLRYSQTHNLYTHKLLFSHHSSYGGSDLEHRFAAMNQYFSFTSFDRNTFEKLFQIAHGVHLTLEIPVLKKVLGLAEHFKLQNVIRYCEREWLIRIEDAPDQETVVWNIIMAIEHRRHHYLALLLRTVESNEVLKEALGYVMTMKLTGESMKLCINYLLENANVDCSE